MRLVHEVIYDLHYRAKEHAIRPLGHVREELLGGERGTLPDLAGRFTQAGLGSVITSRTGNRPNLAIRPGDLRRAMGKERAQDMATLAGMRSDALLDRLCRMLPPTGHAMTPEGDLYA